MPLLTDVDIQVVEVRQGTGYGLGWIYIPAQPSHVRPVLVRGAFAGEKVLGTHIACHSGSRRTPVTGMRRRCIH